jgi:plastocyanin
MDELIVPVAIGLAVGIASIALFSLFFIQQTPEPSWETFTIHVNDDITLVTISEGSSLASSGKTFEPQVIKVVIGVNNTVRWINQDSVAHWIEPDDDKDPGFIAATNPSDPVSFIQPNEYLEYTFTKAGEYGYHGKPWMRGTIIVLENISVMPEDIGVECQQFSLCIYQLQLSDSTYPITLDSMGPLKT